MKEFQNPIKDLGTVEEETVHDLYWDIPKGIKITTTHSGCGCSKPKVKGKKVHVVFSAGKMPNQHRQRGWYEKQVYIYLTDDKENEHKLAFNVKINSKEYASRTVGSKTT